MSRSCWMPWVLFAAGALALSGCVAEGISGPGGGGGPFGAGGSGPPVHGTGGSGAGKSIVEDGSKGPQGGAGGGGANMGIDATGGAGGAGGAGDACADPGPPQVFFMSSDDSSSMGSPALARELLRAGIRPPEGMIRTYEFLNYYRVRYPLPQDDRLGVHVHYAPDPDGSNVFRFQVGVQAFEVVRPPLALTFVVDTSGSLVGEGIGRERAAITAMAKKLQAGDRVNVVIWASENAELLADHVIAGPDDPTLLGVIESLVPNGGSDMHSGLQRGYDLAQKTAQQSRLSRVVLISDGGANLGVTDRTRIAEEAKNGDDLGIYLVGIGVGPAKGYSDTLMDQVTDAGRGSYVYLDSEEEAERVLADRFEEVMDIAARSVEAKLTLPSYFQIQSSSAEKISTNQREVPPQHLAPGDSMVFHQYLGVTSGSVCDTDEVTVGVTWHDPFLHAVSGQNYAETKKQLWELQGEPWQLLKAEAIVLYASALRTGAKSDILEAANAVDRALKDASLIANDPYAGELDEIAELVAKIPAQDP